MYQNVQFVSTNTLIHFEPSLRLRVTYEEQAENDVGGLSRQFFTDLFLAASKNDRNDWTKIDRM